jgi:hypothetical protein
MRVALTLILVICLGLPDRAVAALSGIEIVCKTGRGDHRHFYFGPSSAATGTKKVSSGLSTSSRDNLIKLGRFNGSEGTVRKYGLIERDQPSSSKWWKTETTKDYLKSPSNDVFQVRRLTYWTFREAHKPKDLAGLRGFSDRRSGVLFKSLRKRGAKKGAQFTIQNLTTFRINSGRLSEVSSVSSLYAGKGTSKIIETVSYPPHHYNYYSACALHS